MTPTSSVGLSESLRLGRATIRDIVPYPTERTPCTADLSDNTNLFGAPPAALRELSRSGHEEIARYPGLYARRLRDALADYVLACARIKSSAGAGRTTSSIRRCGRSRSRESTSRTRTRHSA